MAFTTITPHITSTWGIIRNKKKGFPFLRLHYNKNDLSLPVSRVLSCTAIYLGLPSPISSSDIHGKSSDGQPYVTITQSCSGWGLHGIPCYQDIGELLPRLSILTTMGKSQRTIQNRKVKPLRRFISVALSRKSPSPDVIRHPVLCCSDFPHRPFRSAATV